MIIMNDGADGLQKRHQETRDEARESIDSKRRSEEAYEGGERRDVEVVAANFRNAKKDTEKDV